MSEILMDELCITEGGSIRIKPVDLKAGTWIKIRPDKHSFTLLDDPKGFLESGIIRHYPVLNKGEVISFGGYNFDIVDTMPEEAIFTVDTDIVVDFLEPRENGTT